VSSDLLPLKALIPEYAKRLPVVGSDRFYGNLTTTHDLKALLDDVKEVGIIQMEILERLNNESNSSIY